jgi:transposase-like protein
METTNKAGVAGRFVREGRWPREHGQRVVAAWRKSGATLAAFAHAEGIRADRLRYWRDALEAEQRCEDGGKAQESQARSVSFLPVVVRNDLAATKVAIGAAGTTQPGQIDPVWLASFVRALFTAEGEE